MDKRGCLREIVFVARQVAIFAAFAALAFLATLIVLGVARALGWL